RAAADRARGAPVHTAVAGRAVGVDPGVEAGQAVVVGLAGAAALVARTAAPAAPRLAALVGGSEDRVRRLIGGQEAVEALHSPPLPHRARYGQPEDSFTTHQPRSIPMRPSRGRTS